MDRIEDSEHEFELEIRDFDRDLLFKNVETLLQNGKDFNVAQKGTYNAQLVSWLNGVYDSVRQKQASTLLSVEQKQLPEPVPRRNFRKRTLKQMKPYLVDKFEHKAQFEGDAKRAKLIEMAAAEQNLDLLESLQREDKSIRQERMQKALEKEKVKKNRKHIDNRILYSDEDNEDSNNLGDAKNDIMSYLSDVSYDDSSIGGNTSYSRNTSDSESVASDYFSPVPRKGIAVRKYKRNRVTSTNREFESFLDDSFKDLDAANDYSEIEHLLSKYPSNSSLMVNDDANTLESFQTSDAKDTESVLVNDYSSDGSDSSVYSVPEEPMFLNNFGSFYPDSECEEDNRSGIDRMLTRNTTTRTPKRTSTGKPTTDRGNAKKLSGSKSLSRSKSATNGISIRKSSLQRSSSGIARSRTTVVQSKVRRVYEKMKRSKSPNFFNRNPGAKSLTDTYSVYQKEKEKESSKEAGALSGRGADKNTEKQNNEKVKTKKSVVQYSKDDRYQYSRNPHVHTLQLEESSGRYKIRKVSYQKPNEIFMNKQKQSVNMAFYDKLFNNSAKALKVVKLSRCQPPDTSLLEWYKKDIESPLDNVVATSFANNFDESECMIVYSNFLDFLRNKPNCSSDEMLHNLKRMCTVAIQCDFVSRNSLFSIVDIFLQNSQNIIQNTSIINYTNFVFLMFPIIQLHILSIKSEHESNEADRLKFVRHLTKWINWYFDILTEKWHPLLLFNVLRDDYNGQVTIIYETLNIAIRLLSQNDIWQVLERNFKKSTISLDNCLNYTLIFANIANENENGWKVVSALVNNTLFTTNYASEHVQYEDYKALFKFIDRLQNEFGWTQNQETPFKLLVKLLKKRNFINFASEPLNFKIFSSSTAPRKTLNGYFVKLVLESEISKRRNNVKLVQFFEPNTNIFFDANKPDVSLQTFINKLNIYILNTKISSENYSSNVVKLAQNVLDTLDSLNMTENEIFIFSSLEKVFEGLKKFFSVRYESQKKHSVNIFENLISFLFKNLYNLDLKKTVDSIKSIYLFITNAIVTMHSISESDALMFVLSSFGILRIYQLQYFEFNESMDIMIDLLSFVIRVLNKSIGVLQKSKVSNNQQSLYSQIQSRIWTPIMNLVKISEDFLVKEFISNDLLQLFGRISDLLVTVRVENWQSLNYKWKFLSIKRKDLNLKWYSMTLHYGGKQLMRFEYEVYIETLTYNLGLFRNESGFYEFYKNLMISNAHKNPFLEFKYVVQNEYEFNIKKCDLLISFVHLLVQNYRLGINRQLCVSCMLILLKTFRKEYDSYRDNRKYHGIIKRLLLLFNSQSSKPIFIENASQFKEFSNILKHGFRMINSITFTGSDLEMRLNELLESRGDLNREEETQLEVVTFINQRLIQAINAECAETFMNELIACITTNVYFVEQEQEQEQEGEENVSSRRFSILFIPVTLIINHIEIMYKNNDVAVWILLHYQFELLSRLLGSMCTLNQADYMILCEFAINLNKIFYLKFNANCKHLRLSVIDTMLQIIIDLYHLFQGHSDLNLFKDLIKKKSVFLQQDSFQSITMSNNLDLFQRNFQQQLQNPFVNVKIIYKFLTDPEIKNLKFRKRLKINASQVTEKLETFASFFKSDDLMVSEEASEALEGIEEYTPYEIKLYSDLHI